MLASEDLYIDLLCFIYDWGTDSLKRTPVLKYVNCNADVEICTLAEATRQLHKVRYAPDPDLHNWLNKCHMEFDCPDNMLFLPGSTQQALVDHSRFSSLQNWLSNDAGVKSCSAMDYGYSLFLCGKREAFKACTIFGPIPIPLTQKEFH